MRATRWGSSPNVSSRRPQRGSRQTSSTGPRPWCAPVARICVRTASASSSTSAGSHVLARPIACGKTVASRAINPEQISSWTIAGMPSRVCSTRCRWMSFASSAASVGRRSLAPAMRVTWPRPEASRPALSGRQAVVVGELEDPVAAELRELLLQRHAAEQVVGALLGGQRGVEVAGDLEGRHVRSPSRRDEPRTTSRVGRTTCSGSRAGSSIRSSSSRTASKPIRWIDWSTVVSGGSESADSGTLSNPTTERSSGTASPSRPRDRSSSRSPTRRSRRRSPSAVHRARAGRGRPRSRCRPGSRRRGPGRGRTGCRPLRARRGSPARGAVRTRGRGVRRGSRYAGGRARAGARSRSTAPLRLSESTVGSVEERTLWSTATTGAATVTSTLLGVTRIAPSVRALTRASERRSQPTWSSRRPQSEKTTRS